MSKQCNFSIVSDKTTRSYRFLTGFDGLKDLPKEFERARDSILKNISCTNKYFDDILVASKGSLDEHKAIVNRNLINLDNNNMAVK